ncbi:MAG: BLUF domain-containing protein [Amaricoccus sp.]|uniref:BLUF domain-containing protein n=1 Tax=Amaricoccus sp. TaxID=1872485 RepID=UPI0039E4015E
MVTGRRDADLIQLVYTSGGGLPLDARELHCLAEELQLVNARAGLTGLLLHQGDSFYGVLEGSQRRIFSRIERMIADPRLGRVRVLKEEAIASRRFDNWSFGALPPMQAPSDAAEAFILHLARRSR